MKLLETNNALYYIKYMYMYIFRALILYIISLSDVLKMITSDKEKLYGHDIPMDVPIIMFISRCKRLHPMLATAFQVLHFHHFLEEHGPVPEILSEVISLLQQKPSAPEMATLEANDEYLQFMRRYTEYTAVTLGGGHGNTARYWMEYVKLVHVFLMFSRACRMNNLHLFTYILGEMRCLFFVCNRPNYARWMVRYYLNLVNIDNTHPGVRHILENGALSIRRTDKAFSRTPVDMTLEQTVNADAASRLTGIFAFGTIAGA